MKIKISPKYQDKFAVILLILLVFLYFGKTLLPKANEIIYGGDLLSQFYYWKGFLRDNLLSGVIPFWNPYLFSGMPFLSHPGVAAFYPATLLFLILPLSFAFSFIYFLHLIIGGLGMYILAKNYSDRLSALMTALLFALSGYFTARIYAGHFDILTTAVWIPWVINFLLRKKFRQLVIVLCLLILAGYSAYLVFTSIFIIFYIIYKLIQVMPNLFRHPKGILNRVQDDLKPVLAIIIVLGITAVQWLPTWELTGNSIRDQGLPYELASWGSLPITGWKLFINPLNRVELDKISFNLGGGPVANPFDHFPGYAVFIIASFIILVMFGKYLTKINKHLKIHSDFWFFLIICLFFFWISLGNSVGLSLHRLLYGIIPFYRFIRIPIQNLIYPVVLIPLMTGMVLALIKNNLLKVFLGTILVIQLFVFKKDYIFLTANPEQKIERKMAEEIQLTVGEARLLPNFRVISPILERFDLNAPLKLKVQSTGGYDPVILKNYYDYIDRSNGNAGSSLTRYNVEIPPIILKKETLALLNVGKILEEDGSVTVNENYLPRFYFEDDKKCSDEKKTVTIINYDLNKISLKTSNNCNAGLASSEVFYPGWQAKVDGKKAPITISNTAFRAIFVPKGNHIVEYYYYPKIYILGLGISLLSTIVFLRIKNEQT